MVFEKGIDLARIHRQRSGGEVERLVARGPEKGPVVRDDQAGLAVAAEEVLEQDLGPQVEKVGRLVEQEEIRLVEEQGGELHTGLPTAGEFRHRTGESGSLDLELARHLAALPVGLAAVAHQEVEGRLTGVKGVVLPQVADSQPRMPHDLPGVEFLLTENHSEQGALAGAIAADEAHPPVVGDRRRGLIEEHLVAIPLAGVFDVEEDSHRMGWGAGVVKT